MDRPISMKSIGFRIFLIAMWILLAVLYYGFPPKTGTYVIAVLIVAVVQGFFVAPWHYFEPGWKMLRYNLVIFGGAFAACHVYSAVVG